MEQSNTDQKHTLSEKQNRYLPVKRAIDVIRSGVRFKYGLGARA